VAVAVGAHGSGRTPRRGSRACADEVTGAPRATPSGVPIAPRATPSGVPIAPRATPSGVDRAEGDAGHQVAGRPPVRRRRAWLVVTVGAALGVSTAAVVYAAVPTGPGPMSLPGTASAPTAAGAGSTAPVTPQASPTSQPRGGWAGRRTPTAPPPVTGAARALSPKPPATTSLAPTIETEAALAAPLIVQSDLLALVRANFPADQVGNAMAVAECESSQQSIRGPVNTDGTSDWGIFQLNDGGTLQGALAAIGIPAESTEAAQAAAMDPTTNVVAAAHIYADRGWGAWTCGFKQGIVAAIGSSTPGPLDGAYTIVGTDPTPLDPPDWSGASPARSPAPPPAAPAVSPPSLRPPGGPKKPGPASPSNPPAAKPTPVASPGVATPVPATPPSLSPVPATPSPTPALTRSVLPGFDRSP
jgi:hypothetical protein